MPEVGDRVRVESTTVGQAAREGVVVGLIGRLLRIRWSSGGESTVVPGPGAVAVVGKEKESAVKGEAPREPPKEPDDLRQTTPMVGPGRTKVVRPRRLVHTVIGLSVLVALGAGIGIGILVAPSKTTSTTAATTTSPTVATSPKSSQLRPAITSSRGVTGTAGTPFSFTVTTRGVPVPVITRQGQLPHGLSLVDNHDGTAIIYGIPLSNTGGVYNPIIIATFGTGTSRQVTTQELTLRIDQAPSIVNRTTKKVVTSAVPFSVILRTKGYPVASSITESGALPAGVVFDNSGAGTATLAGTPAIGTQGTYVFTITASNGFESPATLTFTLLVKK